MLAYIAHWLLLFHSFQIPWDHHTSFITISLNSTSGWCSWVAGMSFIPPLVSTPLPGHLHPQSCSRFLEASWSTWLQPIDTRLSFVTHRETYARSWSAIMGQHWLPECKINGRKEINSRANCSSWCISSTQLVLELPLVENTHVSTECIIMIHSTECAAIISMYTQHSFIKWYQRQLYKHFKGVTAVPSFPHLVLAKIL